MKLIDLNLQTLYADLTQKISVYRPPHGTVSVRTVSGNNRYYITLPDGRQKYLGTVGDPKGEAKATAARRLADQAKRTKTIVSTLKRSGIPAPDIYTGRVLEALSLSGVFRSGVVLIGTTAYQLYPCVVGAYLDETATRTQDADLALARLAVAKLTMAEPLDVILRRADGSFAPHYSANDKMPKLFRSARTGYEVDVVTTEGRTGGPLQVTALGCAATPLPYLQYLIADPIDVVALYGSGIPVRVPDPARYAVHKLIVTQARAAYSGKKGKDLLQARSLIEVLRENEPERLEAAVEAARSKGPKWRKLVNDGLVLLEGKPKRH